MRYGFVALCGVLGAGCLTETRYACPPGSDVTASTRCGAACASGELSADVCVQVRQACTDGRLSAADCAGIDGDQGMPDVGVEDQGPEDTGVRDLGRDAGPCGMACGIGLRCNEATGECVECLSSGQCTDDATPVCNTTTGTCVGCVDSTDCTEMARPFCLGTECVGCVTNTDCPVSTPVCSLATRTCGPCTTRLDCNGRATAPACNTATGACTLCDVPNESADCPGLRCFNQVSCTQCRAMTVGVDCTSPNASRCDATGTCTPCVNNADCGHISGRNRCDAGTCVQCTVATESTDCGTKSCNPATRTCTTTDRFSRSVCSSCVADSECVQAGGTFRCIPMNYQGVPRGGYCLRAVNANGASGCSRPYLSANIAASLSGAASATYCGIDQNTVSCEAVRALSTSRQCPTGNASECMALGAVCETVGALTNRCTYACSSPLECLPSGAGASCNAGYCGS